jgi:hypothetical protein
MASRLRLGIPDEQTFPFFAGSPLLLLVFVSGAIPVRRMRKDA